MYSPSIGAPGRIVSPAEVLPVDLARTFAIGQRLQGEVVRIVPHGGVLVNFDGQPVLLALAQQVAPGQILTATVAQVSPALLLQLTDELPLSLSAETTPPLAPSPQEGHQAVLTAAQLKAYLMAKQPFGETVTTLGHVLSSHLWVHEMAPALSQAIRDTLAALSPQSALPPDAAQLKTQMDRSGLNYESKVQRMLMGDLTGAVAALAKDLKGQLLELSHRLDMLTHAETDPRSGEAADCPGPGEAGCGCSRVSAIVEPICAARAAASGAPPGAPVCIPYANNAARHTPRRPPRGETCRRAGALYGRPVTRPLDPWCVAHRSCGTWLCSSRDIAGRDPGSRRVSPHCAARFACPTADAWVYAMRRLYCPGARDAGQ